MTPAAIIERATADGVRLALSAAGTIKAVGETATLNRWLPLIRAAKPGIVDYLKATPDLAMDLAELDSLVERLCDLMNYPEGTRQRFNAIRRAMAPATVRAELAYFRQVVTQAEKATP